MISMISFSLSCQMSHHMSALPPLIINQTLMPAREGTDPLPPLSSRNSMSSQQSNIIDLTSIAMNIKHKNDSTPTIKDVIKKIEACCKDTEPLMSVSSSGKFGEGSGGVYLTPKPTHIVNLLAAVDFPLVLSLMNNFPHLKREGVIMMDAGVGMHISCVLFAALGGYHAIGLEIDDTRCALAAKFFNYVVDCFPKAKIVLYNRDLTERGNRAKVAVFLFWD